MVLIYPSEKYSVIIKKIDFKEFPPYWMRILCFILDFAYTESYIRFMKSLFALILVFFTTLPNCGMVFAGNMKEMMPSGDDMEMWEMVSISPIDHPDETLQNPLYNCCSDTTHSLTRNTNLTNPHKNIVCVTRMKIIEYSEAFIPRSSFSILYRQNAPPDPHEYISLIGSSVKNLS